MAKTHAAGKTPMTTQAVARINSATARAGNGSVPKGSFAATAAKAAAHNSASGTKGN